MARLFVAVWPPDHVCDVVAALERPTVEGVRWSRPEQWHVTLRFLGATDRHPVEERLGGLAAAATEAHLGPETALLGRSVLVAPVAGLDELAAAVTAATADLGEPPDGRPFRGHLTLARSRGRRRLDRLPLPVGAAVDAVFAVDEIALVASETRPDGARYRILSRFALAGSN